MTILQRIVYLTAYLIHFLNMDKSELDYGYNKEKYSSHRIEVHHESPQDEPVLSSIIVGLVLAAFITVGLLAVFLQPSSGAM